MKKNRKAIISVYDKQGIAELAGTLINFGFELIASGATCKLLRENGFAVIEVGDFTNFPEVLSGRVKTLHPKIYSGILSRRTGEDRGELAAHAISEIDLVVVNLYPFTQKINSERTLAEMVEYIDVGGVTLIRAAAKNFQHVCVVTDVQDYKKLELSILDEGIEASFRAEMAVKAFALTALYDQSINLYLEKSLLNKRANLEQDSLTREILPKSMNLNLTKAMDLRSGENSHQHAAIYIEEGKSSLARWGKLQGKDLSYNNILDIEAATALMAEFEHQPAAVIIKHNNPCGVALGSNITKAYTRALASDPKSAFGGIVSLNYQIEEDLAHLLSETFLEVIIAPSFSSEALAILNKKKNLRLVINKDSVNQESLSIRSINNGFIAQTPDNILYNSLKCVTKRQPTEQEMQDLLFAWKVCRHVKSNAIVVASQGITLGIGPGQTNRVGSVKIALENVLTFNLEPNNAKIMASDGFFPFADSIKEASIAGISAIIQPGGSIKDAEVIEVADELGIAMLFTNTRHFLH